MKALRKAFTYIELLFIVGVIAVLAAISVPNFLEAQIRAKRSRVVQDMAILSDVLEAYALETGRFPANLVGSTAPTPEELTQNGWTLMCLTTPVAHVSRLPKDTFPVQYIHRQPPSPLIYWRFDAEGVRAGTAPRALLLSPGLDGEFSSRVTSNTLELLPYDPTNGTTSAGDLYITFPGDSRRYETWLPEPMPFPYGTGMMGYGGHGGMGVPMDPGMPYGGPGMGPAMRDPHPADNHEEHLVPMGPGMGPAMPSNPGTGPRPERE